MTNDERGWMSEFAKRTLSLPLLLALAVLLSEATAATGDQSITESARIVRCSVGFGGVYKAGHWTPIWVETTGTLGLAEPLVEVTGEAPWVSGIAGRHHAEVGGFTLSADGRRLVVVSTLDNLLKGAATQALQNLNLAFGLPETMGIPA